MIRVIVLQTIAANTGSMLTPIGNPQNLFLFAQMSVSLGMFLLIMLPLTAAAGIILAVTVFICIPKSSGTIAADTVCRNSAGNAVPVSIGICTSCDSGICYRRDNFSVYGYI